jgi:phage tail sheath protein FI
MPEYLAPGVYVEEVSFRNKSIEGVSTTTTGFVGPARYGPIDLESEIITSLVEFQRVYGDREPLVYNGAERHNYLWHAVRAFFEEGGKRLYVGRVFRSLVSDTATNTEIAPYERPSEDIDQDKSGTTGTVNSDGHARAWLPSDPGAGTRSGSVLVRARFPGEAGNLRVRLTVRLGQNILSGVSGKLTAKSLREFDTVWIGDLASPFDAPVGTGGFYVARYDTAEGTWRFTQANSVNTPKSNSDLRLNAAPGSGLSALDPSVGHQVRIATLRVTVATLDGTSTQVWDSIAFDPNHTNAFGAADSLPDYFAQSPRSISQARELPIVILTGGAIDTGRELLNAIINSNLNPNLATNLNDVESTDGDRSIDLFLTGGSDGQLPTAIEIEGNVDPDTNAKSGLVAFEDLEDISIVAAPGTTANYANDQVDADASMHALISHAERMRYRIAVLDSGEGQAISEVRDMRAKLDSSYAALYYPWVRVLDPVTNSEINLPPSGFVAGIYARNDVQRAVYKAPANEVVNLALGFERMLNKAQQEVLNPEGINCFRFFEGRGFRLWGARTISSDPEWKYVNLRRYFAYLERSIDKGTQWAVFEPNGPRLWDNVRSTVSDFLFNEWQMGALLGDKPEKSYFVRCDRTTMTQNDLDNGRLVCLVGVAPLRPAEFVIFRIGQWTADRKA